MADVGRYSLTFLFDGSQINLDDLEQTARAVLRKHLPSVDLQADCIDPERVQLSIVGSLEDVDACHRKLTPELLDRHSCVRVLDEAGDEIRRQAYAILAQIEQSLRTFINRAMTEVIGFDWWDSMTPLTVRRTVEDVEKRAGHPSAIHHPLEFTYFDDLVSMVTDSVQEWTGDRPLSVADLAELVSDCRSMEEADRRLARKTRRISLWDEVFARYFEQADEWSELRKSITRFVIPVRNKVMHHRPIWLYELRKLSRLEEDVRPLLSSAKRELPLEERVEAHQISMDLIDVIRRQEEELTRITQEPFQRHQREWTRVMSESFRRRDQELARIMQEPFQRHQREWTRVMSESFRRLQGQMVPPTEELVEPPTSEAAPGEDGGAMTYRVYENWSVRPDKAIIHRSDCPYANGGPIRSPTKNGQWHGPFATHQQALEAAQRTGRREVRGCKHCTPP